MTTLTLFDSGGKPISTVGRQHLGIDGTVEAYDSEGYRVPPADIPDTLYFPSQDVFEPEPAEAEWGSLRLANAALRRALRSAMGVIHAACADFDEGHRMPPRTNHAIGRMDDDLRALETMAEVPADYRPHPLELLNRDRTDRPSRGVDDRDIMAAGLPVG